MWSISSVDPYCFGSRPYSISTWCFTESVTLRIGPVRKLGEQITAFVSLLEYAPGEQRRSDCAPGLQPLDFVFFVSSTVVPTSTAAVIDVLVAPGGTAALAGSASVRATAPAASPVHSSRTTNTSFAAARTHPRSASAGCQPLERLSR